MYFTRILLSIVFVLFASTTLAAKPDKSLVCHVGNELGSSGETFQENPDCTIPDGWEGDYVCPDAGKVDLILVSKKAKHIGNPSHSFEDDTGYLWEDYAPEEGIGDDPADFEEGDLVGIDAGCELTEPALACPCWNHYTETELVASFNADTPTGEVKCQANETHYTYISLHPGAGSTDIENTMLTSGNTRCKILARDGKPGKVEDLWGLPDQSLTCREELFSIISKVTWCSD